ncbi:hypothetical protein FHG87_016117 [Trinorchestia longiramus]|nr:hypothetical protein FHG87_016117 [Trinorchestia longiramus]
MKLTAIGCLAELSVVCHTVCVVGLVCCYIASLFIYWEQDLYRVWLSRLSVAVWLLAGAGVAGWLVPASATQPVFAFFCALLLLGLSVEVWEYMQQEEQQGGADRASLVESVVKVCKDDYSSGQRSPSLAKASYGESGGCALSSVAEEDDLEDSSSSGVAEASGPPGGSPGGSPGGAPDRSPSGSSGGAPGGAPGRSPSGSSGGAPGGAPGGSPGGAPGGAPGGSPGGSPSGSPGGGCKVEDMTAPSQEEVATSRPSDLIGPSFAKGADTPPCPASQSSRVADAQPVDKKDDSVGNMYIKGVLMACVLVELWRHHYLLALLPIALVYLVIKKTTFLYLSGGSLGASVSELCCRLRDAVTHWLSCRKDALLPPPVRGVKKVLDRSEAYVLSFISVSLHELVSCCLILAALLLIVCGAVFLAVQIQGESMQLVGVASQIINATVVNNPQFLALLPEDFSATFSGALDDAYLYGRDWLTKWVRDLVGEAEPAKALALEKQVLELWDRVYQAWVVPPPATTRAPLHGPVVTSQAVADTFDSLMQGIANSPGLISLESMTHVMRENVGTILSVLESVWAVLLSNLSLVMSLTSASASAVLGGSLSLLNGLISAVVFLTALFYVLSSSGKTYKPVAILGSLAPGQMNSVGVALEEAINGVFTASLKMGVFYGLWTWLLHSIFATNIVYIPAGESNTNLYSVNIKPWYGTEKTPGRLPAVEGVGAGLCSAGCCVWGSAAGGDVLGLHPWPPGAVRRPPLLDRPGGGWGNILLWSGGRHTGALAAVYPSGRYEPLRCPHTPSPPTALLQVLQAEEEYNVGTVTPASMPPPVAPYSTPSGPLQYPKWLPTVPQVACLPSAPQSLIHCSSQVTC